MIGSSPGIPGVTVYSVGVDDFAYGAGVWLSGTSGTRFVVAGAAVNMGDTTFNSRWPRLRWVSS
jgi:hypothetical protein